MHDVLRTAVIVVTHTPIWVWVLYAGLLFLGFQRTRDSTVPLFRVLLLPLVVTVLAIVSFVGAGLGGLPAMLVGLAIGNAAGWRQERVGATVRLAGGRVWLRADWWSFVQLTLVLVFRYATNVISAMNPALDANPVWHHGTLAISAALSGLFIGRAAARVRVYFAGGIAAPSAA